MSKSVLLIVAPTMKKEEQKTYERYVKEKITCRKNGIVLKFAYGGKNIECKHVIDKVIFDLKNHKEERSIIAQTNAAILKVNKGHVPVKLIMGNISELSRHGCVCIDNFGMVKHFDPSKVPCSMTEALSQM